MPLVLTYVTLPWERFGVPHEQEMGVARFLNDILLPSSGF